MLRSAPANYDNQVNFFASGYNPETGQALASQPNDGAFIGIRYVTGNVAHFAWLRSWAHTQSYLSNSNPILVTSFTGPATAGISVTDTEFATAGPLSQLDPQISASGTSALVQRLAVTRTSSSAARDVELVAYGNWNPTAAQETDVPLSDSGCNAALNTARTATYDAERTAVVAAWKGTDSATNQQAGSAVAFGWSGGTTSWQVGGDSFEAPAQQANPPDAYAELSSAPYSLGDAGNATGQTTAAIMARVAFSGSSRASLVLDTTAATTPGEAIAELDSARSAGYAATLAGVESAWAELLSRAPVPDTPDLRVIGLARRSLITVLLAVYPESGAIVASPATQGPYGEDWVRDGSFINTMLDDNGYSAIVTAHELYYAHTQSQDPHPIPGTPPGNWPMNMYPNGPPGGPIAYEIDETGYGAWTLYDHSLYLQHGQGRQYLQQVFPAITRAADWLTSCEDPATQLECSASIGDSYTPTISLQGAGPVLLGLRSAVNAAQALGVADKQVSSWEARAGQLQAVIAKAYDSQTNDYRSEPYQGGKPEVTGSEARTGYENGGALLWPVQLLPYSNPRMQGEAQATYRSMEASFSGRSGAYEGAQLFGICNAWTPLTPARRSELEAALGQVASTTTTPAGLLGEGWYRWGNGTVTPLNDMPHTWESALFDMSALCIYGATTPAEPVAPSGSPPSSSSAAAEGGPAPGGSGTGGAGGTGGTGGAGGTGGPNQSAERKPPAGSYGAPGPAGGAAPTGSRPVSIPAGKPAAARHLADDLIFYGLPLLIAIGAALAVFEIRRRRRHRL